MAEIMIIKNIRKKLMQYRIIKKELQARREEYNEYLIEVYNPLQGVLLDGLPKGRGGISDPTGNRVARINQRELDYKKNQIESLEAEIFKIESAIADIENPARSVLFFKYIKGVSWEDLSDYTHYQKTQNRKYESIGIEEIINKNLL